MHHEIYCNPPPPLRRDVFVLRPLAFTVSFLSAYYYILFTLLPNTHAHVRPSHDLMCTFRIWKNRKVEYREGVRRMVHYNVFLDINN